MKQSSSDIEKIIARALEPYSPEVSFEALWVERRENRRKPVWRHKALKIPVAALIACILLFSIAFAGYAFFRNIDNTDYPFIEDPQIIGKWQSVDFVNTVEDFTRDKKSFDGDLYLTELAFAKDGRVLSAFEHGNLSFAPSSWTKGFILNKQEETAEKYKIKEIDGITYLFMEWKSGDYILRDMRPGYYILKKVDNQDYSNYPITPSRRDKIDYPFADNPQMLGKWESVDFVKSIDSFKVGEKSWLGGLFLKAFDIREDGKITMTTNSESLTGPYITWTENLIINKARETASRCEIKEIDGETYLFFEWKSGDYSFRGMEPWYYVLKKDE